MIFANFLRTPFLQNTSGWLFLYIRKKNRPNVYRNKNQIFVFGLIKTIFQLELGEVYSAKFYIFPYA